MLRWLRKYEGSRLAIAGLCVAAILFLAVNVLANTVFKGAQIDLTEGNLYTVSQGTRNLLASLQEPVQIRLYYSRNLGEVAPRYAAYYARVRELLDRYVTLSGGKLSVELLEPEPFSDAEDRAVADGMQGLPVSQAGDTGYFGLAGSNTTDGRASIPFFNLEREPFLEYDLTKLVHGLANPDRPVLGVISALPSRPEMGRPPGAPPPLLILDQIREFFTVEDIEPEAAAIPEKVKTLLVIDLKDMSAETLRAIDRFVHAGGRALVFADALVESAGPGEPPPAGAPTDDVNKLLQAWGVKLVDGKVAGDLDAARRVSTGERGGVVGDYVAWLTLGRANFDAADPTMANVERLNLATSAILEPVEQSGLTVTPLVFTGPRSMAVDVDKVRFVPDILGLLRGFQPGGKPLTLAARITGDAPLAFADQPSAEAAKDAAAGKDGDGNAEPGAATGQPAPAQPPGEEKAASVTPPPSGERKPIQVIVVGDADMLYDRFWVQSSDFFGERVDVPTAGNGDFVINALENLADAEALVGLRGRGTSYRPFTLVETLRRDAEALYRAKEQELQQRLKELQQQLAGIEKPGDAQGAPGGEVMLSADDKAAIERFRGEMLTVRKQLRDVQHALRSDIERLEDRVKFVNIAAVPLVLCGVGGIVAVFRRLKRARAKRQAAHG
jgi:gliding motility-associatede transport system auxiliary component